jgi:quinol monooxygenase YgiN
MFRLIAFAGLALAALGSSAAVAQKATFFTVSYVEVGPVLARVGAATLNTYREGGRKDQGAMGLEVYQRIDRPNQFAVVGAWTDQKAYETHISGDSNKKLNEKLATMLAAPVDIRTHSAFSMVPAKPGKESLVVITHVDVISAEKDNAANALEQLADQSRKHSGNLEYDIGRQISRPNHFTVVETWANRGAFDVHQMQKETREFRAKIAPMLGALYDERLYKALP